MKRIKGQVIKLISQEKVNKVFVKERNTHQDLLRFTEGINKNLCKGDWSKWPGFAKSFQKDPLSNAFKKSIREMTLQQKKKKKRTQLNSGKERIGIKWTLSHYSNSRSSVELSRHLHCSIYSGGRGKSCEDDKVSDEAQLFKVIRMTTKNYRTFQDWTTICESDRWKFIVDKHKKNNPDFICKVNVSGHYCHEVCFYLSK